MFIAPQYINKRSADILRFTADRLLDEAARLRGGLQEFTKLAADDISNGALPSAIVPFAKDAVASSTTTLVRTAAQLRLVADEIESKKDFVVGAADGLESEHLLALWNAVVARSVCAELASAVACAESSQPG